jgi:subtilase family serine protease
MKKKKKLTSALAAATLVLSLGTSSSFAATTTNQSVSQGIGSAVLNNAQYFGNADPNSQVTVDFVFKVQHQDQLAQYITDTTTKGSKNFRNYLTPSQFQQKYGASNGAINQLKIYLNRFGITNIKVYPDNLVVTVTGTVAQLNKALSVEIQRAELKGQSFHASKTDPKLPSDLAQNILCVLGLTNYSNFKSQAVKESGDLSSSPQSVPTGVGNTPLDLAKHYNVNPLYQSGATGKGQTIGIVTLADFNPGDAYSYWDQLGISYKPNRVNKVLVDGGSELGAAYGSDETNLDVQQSGTLAPQADIKVYVAPNTDTGFTDAFATAINDNVAQSISVSWGESETIIQAAVDANVETPAYPYVFNELYMQAAAQGQATFAASGDSGAYAAERDLGTFDLSTLNPSDSPYITAAGGTTLPYSRTLNGVSVSVNKERAWGYDYYWPIAEQLGYVFPHSIYFEGAGGGFSKYFATPDYQKGVNGVNTFHAVNLVLPSADFTSVTENPNPTVVSGTGTGRNMPDLSMDADPHTGYAVYMNLPDAQGWAKYGGTSFVAPQLAGLSALINSSVGQRVGFWNPQIYRFAQQSNSPFTPLNDTGVTNDNGYYTGTPGTIYNQATGLGIPDVTALAKKFAGQ